MIAAPRILIADDDGAICDLLTAFFTKKGFDVVAVEDGLKAQEAIVGPGGVDLAILDVMMPGYTGLQVIEAVREVGCMVPIIVATAHGHSEQVVQALSVGADDFVAKPFDLAILLARVKAALRRSRPAFAVPSTESSGPVPIFPALSGPIGEGAVLDGRYELMREIGRGSFGVVWQARHLGLEVNVAVKLLHKNGGSGTQKLDGEGHTIGGDQTPRPAGVSDELRLEGVRGARVQHPHAVRVLDVGRLPDAQNYLVMELLVGPTVEDLLVRNGAMPVARVVEILRPVVDVLTAAHNQGVIHRDIKPANVLLHKGAGATVETVKVLDFGVAKLVGADVEGPGGHPGEETSSRIIAGSPAYLAPERLRGLPYDGRADVYAVGVMFFEMVTGRVPFRAEGDVMKVALMHLREPAPRPSTVRPGLSPMVDQVAARLLCKDPSVRPTIEETAALLASLEAPQTPSEASP